VLQSGMAHTSALQRRHGQVATTTNTTNTFYDHDNIGLAYAKAAIIA
jgi:hypothetical protein